MVLRLEVLDYEGPSRWRWRLTDAGGAFVADHQVNVDAGAWQFEAFTDLERYLRWNAAPDRRLQSEAELTAQVGEWIGTELLGAVGVAMAQRLGLVQLQVPAVAGVLAYRPWELAFVNGKPLAVQQVSF